jgi:hypothetical protein
LVVKLCLPSNKLEKDRKLGHFGTMETSVNIPDDMAEEVKRVAKVLNESTATVLRLAIRAGLPTVGQQAPRPEGYFADMYQDYPQERIDLEEASSKVNVASEERDRE